MDPSHFVGPGQRPHGAIAHEQVGDRAVDGGVGQEGAAGAVEAPDVAVVAADVDAGCVGSDLSFGAGGQVDDVIGAVPVEAEDPGRGAVD